MFKKKERLTHQELQNLLKNGRRAHGTCVSLVCAQGGQVKYGVVVSKKTAPHAVMRHLLRRRVYAIFKKSAHKHKDQHCAIIIKPCAVNMSYKKLTQDIEKLI